ncbi:MAG TPA: sugar phosphate isomerase/epimerase [Firmicutes bacterium]|nr:sugar phosphate isomerase/epimerase [Bacillota bacterium]
MRVCNSELIVLNHPIIENVDRLVKTGCNRIELMMDGAAWDSYQADFSTLIGKLRSRNVHYSIHPAAWDINLAAATKILREAAWEHHLQALNFGVEIGASQVVIHPGFVGSPCFSKELAQKRAREFTDRLADKAKSLGIRLAFENVGINGQSIYTEGEFIKALDDVDPVVGYLIDTGHAHVNNWDIPRLIKTLSNRLVGLHIHDNHGKQDEHLPMYEGSIVWDEVLEAIKTYARDCELILEYAPGTPLEELVKGRNTLLDRLA